MLNLSFLSFVLLQDALQLQMLFPQWELRSLHFFVDNVPGSLRGSDWNQAHGSCQGLRCESHGINWVGKPVCPSYGAYGLPLLCWYGSMVIGLWWCRISLLTLSCECVDHSKCGDISCLSVDIWWLYLFICLYIGEEFSVWWEPNFLYSELAKG